MSDKKRYRAGAIGRTGGGNYGHGLHLGFLGAEQVDFVAVADPDEAGRQKVVEETGAGGSYADYREMLEKERPDLVTVGPRWVDCHEEMVLACVEAGCHIYCEKPMAASLEVGDRMVAAADRAGVKLAVAHQGVYLPQVQEVKRLLEEDRIGPVQAIYALGKQDTRGGGEDMLVLGTHLFNQIRFFVGDVAWMSAHVTAEGRAIGSDDVREAREPIGPVAGDCINSYFAFRNGVSVHYASRANQPGEGRSYGMEIVGREGRMVLRGGGTGDVLVYPYDLWAPEDASQQWESLSLETAALGEGNRLAVLDLIDAIEGDRDPISSGRSAVAALEMILGAYASQITGSRVVFPIADRRHPLEALI